VGQPCTIFVAGPASSFFIALASPIIAACISAVRAPPPDARLGGWRSAAHAAALLPAFFRSLLCASLSPGRRGGGWSCLTTRYALQGAAEQSRAERARTAPSKQALGAGGVDLGFGRIVASEIEAPNMLVNMV
jgi:hypothetical protein